MTSHYSLRGPTAKRQWSPSPNGKRGSRQQQSQQDQYTTQASGQASYAPISPAPGSLNALRSEVQQNQYAYNNTGTSGQYNGQHNIAGTSSGPLTYQPRGSYLLQAGKLNAYEQHVLRPDTSRIQEILEQDEEPEYKPMAMKPKSLKPPAEYHHESEDSDSSAHEGPPAPVYIPKIKARKYSAVPSTEKSTPTYQLKRARNNDAVRKSRMKSKEMEEKRNKETEEMKMKIVRLEQELEMEKKARADDKKLIEQLLKERQCPTQPGQSSKSCQPSTSSYRQPANYYPNQAYSNNPVRNRMN